MPLSHVCVSGFSTDPSPVQVYTQLGAPLLDKAFGGFNATIFACRILRVGCVSLSRRSSRELHVRRPNWIWKDSLHVRQSGCQGNHSSHEPRAI